MPLEFCEFKVKMNTTLIGHALHKNDSQGQFNLQIQGEETTRLSLHSVASAAKLNHASPKNMRAQKKEYYELGNHQKTKKYIE